MTKSLDEEFEKKPRGYFKPSELAEEAKILDLELQGGSQNLKNRYLQSKGVGTFKEENGILKMISIKENQIENFNKYDKLFNSWKNGNMSKLRKKI